MPRVSALTAARGREFACSADRSHSALRCNRLRLCMRREMHKVVVITKEANAVTRIMMEEEADRMLAHN